MPRFEDRRSARVPHPPAVAFAPVRRIGGGTGWYAWDALWRLRGRIDRLVGGPGLAGRADADALAVGETLDFWVVEAFEPDRLLRLLAKMRVPGEARLEFRIEPVEDGSVLHQEATFDARGLLGRAYWYAVLPFHGLVFGGMLRGLVRAMDAEAARAREQLSRSRHEIGTRS